MVLTEGGAADDLDDCDDSEGSGGTVWYTFNATGENGGVATFDVCDADFDTKILVFNDHLY